MKSRLKVSKPDKARDLIIFQNELQAEGNGETEKINSPEKKMESILIKANTRNPLSPGFGTISVWLLVKRIHILFSLFTERFKRKRNRSRKIMKSYNSVHQNANLRKSVGVYKNTEDEWDGH